MRQLFTLIVYIALVACASPSAMRGSPPVRVLFVGNSLTYVGNLPAVLDGLSAKNGRSSSSDMIVTGGATLTDWVKSGIVTRALQANQYSFVVLQERGGDFMCGFGPEVCVNATTSLTTLADEVRRHGATPILLGTYQSYPPASKRIEETEAAAARTLGIYYVPVSERLRNAQMARPELSWFAPDGVHPGRDLTVLDALLLYEALYEQRPTAISFAIDAPIYTYMSWLEPELRSAKSGAPHGDAEMGLTYSSEEVAAVMKGLW